MELCHRFKDIKEFRQKKGMMIPFFLQCQSETLNTNRKNIPLHAKAGVWLVVYYFYLGCMSYIGSYGPLQSYLLPAPWDTIVTALGALIFYYWGVYSALQEPTIETSDVKDAPFQKT